MQYKHFKLPDGELSPCIISIDDEGVVRFVPDSESNTDWQNYQIWLAADPENQPLPADEE